MTGLRNAIADASGRQLFLLSIAVAATALAGGSARATIPALIVLRPLLVLVLVTMVALPGDRDWRGLRLSGLLLALFAASILAQLVPLPVAWWQALPGHGRYATALAASGATALPLSLAADLTLNSLLALLPATCVIAAYAAMRPEHRWATAWLAAGVAAASLLFALAQIGGQDTGAYLYGRRQDYVAGLLTNRNHQAVLLSAALPLLAVLARRAAGRRLGMPLVAALAVAGAAMLPMILLTGSRQGLVLAGAALVAALALLPRPAAQSWGRFAPSGRMIVIGVVGLIAVLLLLALATGRAVSVTRLLTLTAGADARLRNLPTVLAMTRDFFPAGIGYGAFDPVYRGFEPDALLHGSYFNHAHDDLLETVLTGGLPGALLMSAAFGVLVARGMHMTGRDADASRRACYLDRAGLVIVALFGAASVVDYPLRAPVVSIIVALAMCWVAAPPALPPQRIRESTA